ncbi:hypothetical protein DE146DRAFT_471481 [Phaeosphaeria sp. MPI-PUGE-AT-0046c]|nr:hypothetical protein DE146DRAFT_471481 [Phaeosphaeria sp. MPI-PUGE-AT-0046c]
MPAAQAANPTPAQDEDTSVRLHITPLKPDLLKLYLAPSVLPLAKNVSYHVVETFPERGYGYVELPESEALKIRNKLNGTTLRGSKVRIEMAKPEKRKAREEADAAKAEAEAERPSKRVKKEKRKREQGVLEGAELENDRKVKRGWTEPPTKGKKERKEKKDKDMANEQKQEQKKSKYTKEPEMLFKAKLTPVAAAEVARKEKKEKKKDKKSKSREVVVHEFEKNTKTPSFLKETKVTSEKKPAVEYVNGQGWVDEDGNIVEPETGKARNRRVLELVDKPVETEPKKSTASPKAVKEGKKKEKAASTPPESESEADDDESSVVSSSSEDSSSESEAEESEAESAPSTPATAVNGTKAAEIVETIDAGEKEVHPLEALFKRAKPSPGSLDLSTPKKLTPINTSFSFFENDEPMDVDAPGQVVENPPTTPFTQRDLEWRGLRSAAPTPDTAAIGRRFSFDWRKGSQEADNDEDDDDMGDAEAEQELSQNTKANSSNKRLPGVAEEDEDDDAAANATENDTEEKPESEFRKWFWENRGDLNRAWKKRRRDALKTKRHTENKKMTPGRRVN